MRERIRAVRAEPGCSKAAPCKEGEGKCHSNDDCQGQLECWHTTHHVSPPGVDVTALQGVNVCFDPETPSSYLGLGVEEYFKHLSLALSQWISKGARLFKLDGIGNPAGGSETLEEDFDSAVTLIAAIRKAQSDIFINLSTGTWPSPFWLLHSDTIWRRGHDHYFEGPPGPPRERWITYRDAMVYKNVVLESPLFPLSSIMTHGIIFAQSAWDLNAPEVLRDPFQHEVRSAFGSGAMLQELYITPHLLKSQNWDDLAEAALWATSRLEVLIDAHWVGGDPAEGKIYGWAAWQLDSAILTLRNPSPTAQTVRLDALHVFELPNSAAPILYLNAPFPDQRPHRIILRKGQPLELSLSPYAVLVFDSSAPKPATITIIADLFWDYGHLLVWTVCLLVGASSFLPAASSRRPAARPTGEELRRLRIQAIEKGTLANTH